MASLEKVSRQYRGKMASGYDEKRLKQRRWHEEDRIVGEMLEQTHESHVLDCPVGTGRFIPTYRRLGMRGHGLDSSDEMLALARRKNRGEILSLQRGSADQLPYVNGKFDVAVCVRFFNLIEPTALRKCFAELDRVTMHWIICTVRLGDAYYSNSAMCTHEERGWWRIVRARGWEVVRDETEPFVKGWHLMLLRRK